MSNQNQMQVSVDLPIKMELTAGDWSQILSALNEGPRKIVQPIYEKINTELMAAASAAQNPAAKMAEPAETIEEALEVVK
jgi:hypothetical protein